MTVAISNVASLQQAREALHVSVSQIKTFLLCAERYRQIYVLRTPPAHRPSALAFGSAFHEALAAFYGELAENGNALPFSELSEIFGASWAGQLLREPAVLFGKKETAEGMLEKAHGMLAAFHEHGLRPAEVLGVEVPFSIPIPGREEQLVGAFDLVARDEEGGVLVVEHKSAARKWTDAQLRWDLQATAYTWAASELGLGEVEVVYQIVTKTKKPAVDIRGVSRGESDIGELHRVVDGVLRAVEAGAFWPSRGWMCAQCAHASECAP